MHVSATCAVVFATDHGPAQDNDSHADDDSSSTDATKAAARQSRRGSVGKLNKIDGEKWGSLKVLLAALLSKNPADRPENWAEVVHLVDQGDTDGLKEQLARIQVKRDTGFADLKEPLTDQLGKLNGTMEERFTSLTQFVTLMEEAQAPYLFRFIDPAGKADEDASLATEVKGAIKDAVNDTIKEAGGQVAADLEDEVHSAQNAANDSTGPADGAEKISKRTGRFKRMSAWLPKARDPLKCVRNMVDTALD